jgi:hypothetical protein
MPRRSIVIAICVFVLSSIASQAHAQTYYPGRPLSTQGFAFLFAGGTNSAGQIIGYGADASGGRVAVYWPSADDAPVQMRSDGIGVVFAYGLNDAGEAVGFDFTTGFYWSSLTAAPVPMQRGAFSGYGIQPFTINNYGEVVGFAYNAVISYAPLYWASPSAVPVQLPTGTFRDIAAIGINDASEIVGFGVDSATGQYVPLLWASPMSTPTALPTGGFFSPLALGIGPTGRITGNGLSAGLNATLFWASPTTPPIQLADGGVYDFTEAIGINAAGQITGTGYGPGGSVPLVWTPLTPASMLNDLKALLLSMGLPGKTGKNLDDALLAIQSGDTARAAKELQKFVKDVGKGLQKDELTCAQARPLVDAAKEIVVALGEPPLSDPLPCP